MSEITMQPCEVTAAAKNKVYGHADPALTYSISSGSLVTGDGFSGDLARAAGENVGLYDITQGSLTAGSNYDLSFVGEIGGASCRARVEISVVAVSLKRKAGR